MSTHDSTHIYKFPNAETCSRAITLSILKDKPIKMEFFTNSLFGECEIVVTQNNEKILYKSESDHTSPIINLEAVEFLNVSCNEKETELLLETLNSIYIVHQNIDKDVFGKFFKYNTLLKSM